MKEATAVLVALERECLRVDEAIARRDWPTCDSSWSAQRRLTHQLGNLLAEIPGDSPDRARIMDRIERLRRYRDGQLHRLQAYRDSIGKRLATFGRSRLMQKANAPERSAKILDLTS